MNVEEDCGKGTAIL